MAFILPELPYAKTAFGKDISEETFNYHHGKHHNAYVVKANELVGADAALQGKSLLELVELSKGGAKPGLFNQVGQIWNHSFYWLGLSPEKQEPTGKLAELITRDFGSVDALVEKLKAEAVGHFASGWAALNLDGDKLVVTSYHDADTPVAHGATPLFIFDVWEHAYYVDYRNQREKYVQALIEKRLNWDFAEQNLNAGSGR